MRVLVDMDGVIADFEGGFLKKWREQNPDMPFIPLKERNSYYIVNQYPVELKELIDKILLGSGFFTALRPIPGSIEALLEMKHLGIEVFICSTPFSAYKNCVLEKYEWVDK